MTLPCSHLDEFFDGELAAGDTDAFRAHLATCDRCQHALSGRMQEVMVAGEAAATNVVIPIERARARTRRFAVGVTMIAVAAAIVLVWSLRSRMPGPPAQVALDVTLTIERGAITMRGQSAHVGDHVRATTRNALWVYHGDHELLLACPGSPTCQADGADIELTAPGTYSFVILAPSTSLPAPRGSVDSDVSAAVQAGIRHRIETLDVE